MGGADSLAVRALQVAMPARGEGQAVRSLRGLTSGQEAQAVGECGPGEVAGCQPGCT